MDWLWHIKTKLHLTDKKKYYYFLLTSEKFSLKLLRRYDAIKIWDEISLNFPEMLIIGKYVKIMFKNRDSPYYFLGSRGQKIKNITQFEQKRLFFFIWCLWIFLLPRFGKSFKKDPSSKRSDLNWLLLPLLLSKSGDHWNCWKGETYIFLKITLSQFGNITSSCSISLKRDNHCKCKSSKLENSFGLISFLNRDAFVLLQKAFSSKLWEHFYLFIYFLKTAHIISEFSLVFLLLVSVLRICQFFEWDS